MSKEQNKRTKDGTAWPIGKLESEHRKLLVSGDNPKRLKEIQNILDWFNWGLK